MEDCVVICPACMVHVSDDQASDDQVSDSSGIVCRWLFDVGAC